MRLPQPAAAKGKKVSFHSSLAPCTNQCQSILHLLCKDSCLYDVLHVLREISKKKLCFKIHVFVWMVLTDLCGVH